VLATHVSDTECCTVTVVPVPDNEIVAGELPASLETVAVALAAPALWGAKATVMEVEAPAATVNGVTVLVLKAKPEGATLIDETVTVALPELERVTVFELVLPTFTLPNERDTGEAFSVPTGVETPVPLKVTTLGELLRLLTIEAEPLALPTLVGANATVAV